MYMGDAVNWHYILDKWNKIQSSLIEKEQYKVLTSVGHVLISLEYLGMTL